MSVNVVSKLKIILADHISAIKLQDYFLNLNAEISLEVALGSP